jgi:hypothetical protein
MEILVTADVTGALLEQKAHFTSANAASWKNFPAQERGLVGVPVSTMFDPVHARDRNRLQWPVNLLSHTRAQRGTLRIVTRLPAAVREFEGSRNFFVCRLRTRAVNQP